MNQEMLQKIVFAPLLFLFLSACGLKYTPTETPETSTEKRHLAIQNHLKETFQKDSSVYESIAFGKTQTLKPISYKVDRNVKLSDHFPVIAEFKID